MVAGLLLAGCGGATVHDSASRSPGMRTVARDQLARGDTVAALVTLRETTRRYPHDAAAWNDLALLQERSGDLAASQSSYESAIRADPDHAESHLNFAVHLMRRGVTGRARTEFEEAVAARPTDPTPHWNFGAALVDVGKPDLAVPHFEAALRLDPRCGPAAAELGRAHARAGRRGAALAAFARAESLGVATPTFCLNYGIELLAAKRYDDAVIRLERTVRRDSTRAAAWSHLGVAHGRAGRFEPARAALERAHRLAPDDEDVRFNLVQMFSRLEQHAEVDALFVARAPQRADLIAAWGMAARALGDGARAQRLLHDATQRAPRDATIWNNYGVVLAENGDLAAALTVWRQILSFAPDDAIARANLAARGATPGAAPAGKED